jgi:BON domain
MTNRNDENRERVEGARGQEAGRQRDDQNRGNRQENSGGSENRWRGNQESYGDSQSRNMNPDFQDSEDWRTGDDSRYGSDRGGSYGNQSSYGNQGWMGGNQPGEQRGWESGQGSYGQNSGWGGNQSESGSGNTSGGRRGYSDSRQGGFRQGMSPNFNRQNEWSSNHGVGIGLGGAESSEYSNASPAGSYYDHTRGGSMGSGMMGGGTGHYGGGISQYGEQQGQHAGRGPKGYKRSDERIKEDVNERLTHDAHIDAGDIEVNVKDGEVTLTGMVDGRHTKRRAEDVIENVSGVREIHNQLRVRSGQDIGNGVGMTTGSNKQGQANKETAGTGSSKT